MIALPLRVLLTRLAPLRRHAPRLTQLVTAHAFKRALDPLVFPAPIRLFRDGENDQTRLDPEIGAADATEDPPAAIAGEEAADAAVISGPRKKIFAPVSGVLAALGPAACL